MTDRIKKLLEILKKEEYKAKRTTCDVVVDESLSDYMKDAHLLKFMLEKENPYLHEGERIGFNRTNSSYYPDESREDGIAWTEGNIVPDYETALNRGMNAIRADISQKLDTCEAEKRELYTSMLMCIDASLDYARRCAAEAEKCGARELSECLKRVPFEPAESLLDACVFMKFIIFTLRCNRNIHITLGRFDKYMRKFYLYDLKHGKSSEELMEIIQEFFISLNFDTDLYQGVQKGDNGQSLVLGGCGSFDEFSKLCMQASLELNLIDPKINLRVDKNTPIELYEYGTLMTKQGMGFPQYSNDDVVIPGLIELGYAPEDAQDYAVAACWEFIIPAKGMDIPNIATMNFPKVIDTAVHRHLCKSRDFDEFMGKVHEEIIAECESIVEEKTKCILKVSPYLSIFVRNCIDSGRDIRDCGAVYNNYGCHGAGISTAADSLAAIKEVVFEKGECTAQQLIDALDNDFAGNEKLRNRLLSCPKMGNAIACVDELAYSIMRTFADNINGKPNGKGGIFRAGTGSAHEYWYSAIKVGATADGRHANKPYGSSFSPSLEASVAGPLSCVKSFTGFDLKKIINGGPLTLEIHDTVFRNSDGIKKVAQLVKAFIALGGHQLQLNCVNRDVLLDAMEHPEEHKNLIVRVWGWSGYFNELDTPFKEHIIQRTEFKM